MALSINELERRIVAAEDDADAMLWEQARLVVAQYESGLSQQQIADGWINVRAHPPEPYSQQHVSRVIQLFRYYRGSEARPRFRDAYDKLAHPPKPKPDPAPFHSMVALDVLHTAVRRQLEAWPPDALFLAVQALRQLADEFEGDADVNRRLGTDCAVPSGNRVIAGDVAVSA